MKYLPVAASLFLKNRNNFVSKMQPGSVCILNANDEFPRSGDQNFLFKQNPDLFYLSGIDQEQTILILFPDSPNPRHRELLFLRETNEHIAVWEGHKYTRAEASAASGIPVDQIYWLPDFENILPTCMHYAKHIYLNTNENDRYGNQTDYRDLRFIRSLRKKYPLHDFLRVAPILSDLRMIKSAVEIELITKAIEITGNAFTKVLNYLKPAVSEYELEAEIMHEFIRSRATGHAYNPIIASGAQACILHYNENNRACEAGDLVLMDFGAEYGNYNADMSRTIPVNGKFNPRQREVYAAVLRIFKQAKALLIPGMLLEDYRKQTDTMAEKEVIGLGLIKEMALSESGNTGFRKFYPHGISHFLGLDVHDVGDRYTRLLPGMLLTCEPGIYIPEENIGIRLENNILITETGNIDLMQHIPMEIDEIESLMKLNHKN